MCATQIFGAVGADYLSPQSLARNLPRMLKDANAAQLADGVATHTGITLTFSKSLDVQTAEQPANYAIESPEGTVYTAESAVYEKPSHSVVLSGLTLPAGAKLKVTSRNITDAGGVAVSPAANSVELEVPPDASAPAVAAVSPAPASVGAIPAVAKEPVHAVTSKKPVDMRAPAVLQCEATASSVKISYSSTMDAKEVETLDNYVVESPVGNTQHPHAAMYSPTAHSVLLSGCSFQPDDPVRVTVKHVHSANGVPISNSRNSATYAALTTWKYVLGFGLPTIIAFIVSVVWFARRDL